MLLRRALAFVVLALCGALVSSVAASGASAAGPAAPLTAVPNADGSQSLTWSLQGSSDEINVLPHLRCAADPTSSGLFAGAAIPCVWFVDHKSPLAAEAPLGCPGTGQAYASWRCNTRGYRDIIVRAAQNVGDRSIVIFNTKAQGGSGMCSPIPLAVQLGSGTGELRGADGCREFVYCESDYKGTVYADDLDVIRGCATVKRGTVAVGGDAAPSDPTVPSGTAKKSTLDLSTCPGAKSGKKGNSPLYSVYNKPRGKRGVLVHISMRRAVPITVEVRVKQADGSKVVRWIARCAKKGKNVIALPDATGGQKDRRNYRVIVRSPNSTYPLISSWEILPRK